MDSGLGKYCWALLLASVILGGCVDDHFADCPSSPSPRKGLHVAFDWSLDSGASPKGMRVAFHPLTDPSAPVVRYDLDPFYGGDVNIAPGRYAVITYNNDTESLRFDSIDDWSHALVMGLESSVTDPMKMTRATDSFRPVASEAVRRCPDELWSDSRREITISSDSTPTLTLSPSPLHCNFTYDITGITHLDRAVKMSASITGMGESVNLATRSLNAARCSHPVPALIRRDSVMGSFRSFGCPRTDTVSHLMELYVVTRDGRGFRFHGPRGSEWDVTSQVHSAKDHRHVAIHIRTAIEIPDSTSKSSGSFDPAIDSWEDVHVVVPL